MLNKAPALAQDGLPYRLLTLRNSARGWIRTLMDWGATLLSARVPMPDGSVRETLLGCASLSSISTGPPILWRVRRALYEPHCEKPFELDGIPATLLPKRG